jgi:hypothetical protein
VRSALVVNLLTENNLPYYSESAARVQGDRVCEVDSAIEIARQLDID